MLPAMAGNLRRRILGRLLLVAVALAAIAGGAAYFLDRRAIDQRILSLALEESRGLATHVGFLSTPRPDDFEALRQQVTAHVLAEHIAEGHFVVIEIYDLARRKVVEASHPAFTEVEKVVDAESHPFGEGDQLSHHWLSIGGVSYVQVFAPLKVGGRTTAYFEGTFRVDPESMRRMNRELISAVLLVVLVVFATAVALYPLMLRLNRDLLQLSDDLSYANMGMLAALGSAVARRDRGTNAHNYRVTIYAIHLARALGLSYDQIRGLIKGAFLHDVGKIGIADAILRKPGRLTPEETHVMQAHVRYGVEIVGKFEWLADAVDVIRCHHERVDGNGYPAGLKGSAIPIAARIFTVVDVFDALTTRRPYKAPISLEETMRTLEAGRGLSFDPEVLDAFESLAPELYRAISTSDELQVARVLDHLLVHYFPAPAGAHGARQLPQMQMPTLTPAPVPTVANLDYLSGAWSLDWPGRGRDPGQGAREGKVQEEPARDDPFREDPFRDDLFQEESVPQEPLTALAQPSSAELRRSVTNMWPGAWVMQNGSRLASATACGVTPQAQKTGSSPGRSSTGSPKSGRARSAMPSASGAPTWTGAPWTRSNRPVTRTASGNQRRRDGPHADHQRSLEAAGGLRSAGWSGTWGRCSSSPRGAAGPRPAAERLLEGEAAADQEGDQVLAPERASRRRPRRTAGPRGRRGSAAGRCAGRRRGRRPGSARPASSTSITRAGLGVALAEEQEVEGGLARHHHQVGLDPAAALAGGGSGPASLARGLAQLGGCHGRSSHPQVGALHQVAPQQLGAGPLGHHPPGLDHQWPGGPPRGPASRSAPPAAPPRRSG